MSLKLACLEPMEFRALLARPSVYKPLMRVGLCVDPVELMNSGNVLFNDAGFVMVCPSDESVSEIHVGFDLEAHPVAMVGLLRSAVDEIFAKTETVAVFGRTNNKFLHRVCVDMIGFARVGKNPEGEFILKMGLVDWMAHSHQARRTGSEFCSAAKIASEYPLFNGFLGGVVMANRYKQMPKAIKAYHSVAPVFGFPPLMVASWSPVVLEVFGNQVQIEGV